MFAILGGWLVSRSRCCRPMSEPEGWDRLVHRRAAHVLFTDGTWRTAQVTGWRHARGRWFARLSWPGGGSGWHVHDRRCIHPI